jgi:predicted GNAT family acetyltransferase
MMNGGEVRHNQERGRYELKVGGAIAITAYRRDGDVLSFTHTEVPEELEGQGIGSRLVAGALADLRANGWRAAPLCSFVRHYIDTHPEEQDLLA